MEIRGTEQINVRHRRGRRGVVTDPFKSPSTVTLNVTVWRDNVKVFSGPLPDMPLGLTIMGARDQIMKTMKWFTREIRDRDRIRMTLYKFYPVPLIDELGFPEPKVNLLRTDPDMRRILSRKLERGPEIFTLNIATRPGVDILTRIQGRFRKDYCQYCGKRADSECGKCGMSFCCQAHLKKMHHYCE